MKAKSANEKPRKRGRPSENGGEPMVNHTVRLPISLLARAEAEAKLAETDLSHLIREGLEKRLGKERS